MHKMVDGATAIMNEQLLILGAGLDTWYHHCCRRSFHVDYENIVSDYMLANVSPNTCLVSADLRDLNSLEAGLLHNGFDFNKGTVILIECVLCYIDMKHVKALLSYLSGKLTTSILLLYNPILPHMQHDYDGAISTIQKHRTIDDHSFSRHLQRGFASKGSPIRSISESATDVTELLLSEGYKYVNTMTMEQASFSLLAPSAPTTNDPVLGKKEAFDEHISERLLTQRYIVSWCSNSSDCFRKLSSALMACQNHRTHKEMDSKSIKPTQLGANKTGM